MNDKKNTPLVSICMPLYNAEKWIKETLIELKKQSYKNIEIIIVDDKSKDKSLEIAKSFQSDNIKVYTNDKKGACSARNYAFSKSNGEYIKFMDADDFCTPNLIEKQIDTLKKLSHDDIVFSPLKMLYPDGKLILPERSLDKNYDKAFDLQIKILKRRGFNVPHCYLMHRNLVLKSKGWDEDVLKNQDGEYFSRVLAQANKAICIKDEFAIWRQTGTGVSSQLSLKAVESMLETYKKIFNLSISIYDTEEMRKICGRFMGLFVFREYPELKPNISRVEDILKDINAPLLLPERRILKIFNMFFKWKTSMSLIHKLKLV